MKEYYSWDLKVGEHGMDSYGSEYGLVQTLWAYDMCVQSGKWKKSAWGISKFNLLP